MKAKLTQNQYFGLRNSLPYGLSPGSQYIAIDTDELFIYNSGGIAILANGESSTPTLQQVLDTGNNADKGISVISDSGLIENWNADTTVGVYLQSTAIKSYIGLSSDTSAIDFELTANGDTGKMTAQNASGSLLLDFFTGITNNVTLQFPPKATGTYTIATTDDITTPNLQEVTDAGYTTTNTLEAADEGTYSRLYPSGGLKLADDYESLQFTKTGKVYCNTPQSSAQIQFPIERGSNINFPIGYGTLFLLANSVVAPTSSTDDGEKGEVRIVGGYRYECIALNTWVRSAVETTF